jgi:hypothetical protein
VKRCRGGIETAILPAILFAPMFGVLLGSCGTRPANKRGCFLGDPSEAPGLMETSVIQVSHYLDRRAVPLFDQDAGALLACAFYRGLRRYIARLRRPELAADVSHLAVSRVGRSCLSKEDCHLDAEKVVRQLSERARQMYELRNAGYGWKEIADKFEISDAAARAEFSRELRRIKGLLGDKRLFTQDPPDTGQEQ